MYSDRKQNLNAGLFNICYNCCSDLCQVLTYSSNEENRLAEPKMHLITEY